MKWHVFVPVMIALIAAQSLASVGLRLGAGPEVIPLTYNDLKDYNTGFGYSFRSDIVWGRFSATTVEMGYRRWNLDGPLFKSRFQLWRIGLVQRIYPLFFRSSRVSPYIGLGITASNRDRISLNIADADFAGVTILSGCEIPLYSSRIWADPFVRWELNIETDYWYSYVCLGVNLIWKLF